MQLVFEEIQAKKIINIHKHVDGPWFWGKYSAHPYIGCRSGCEFCYSRGSRYLGGKDPEKYDTHIRVKVNAVELFRKELKRLKPEIITCGDWQQPAEVRYKLSRQMLKEVYDCKFPLYIVERSPLLVRDLDLLIEINRQSWLGVTFSLSGIDPRLKHAFEPRSPGVYQRLKAMERIAQAGILVGASLMPIFPLIGDSPDQIQDVLRAVKDHGGSFVLAGALTMDGIQAVRTMTAARSFDAEIESSWRNLYHWLPHGQPTYGPPAAYNARLGCLVQELCARNGLLDRMPRYIIPGPLATNKRIAEKLFLKTYDLELEQAGQYSIWAYRKAAWTVDEMSEDIAQINRIGGVKALRALPNIGTAIAAEISTWLSGDN